MERSDATHLAVAAILLGVGGVGLSILAPLTASADSPDWTAVWFLASAAAFGLFSALGVYVVVAVYVGWPLPPTAAQRAFRPNLADLKARIRHRDERHAIVEISVRNRGRGDLNDALVNLIVPEFVDEVERCTADGGPGRPEHAGAFWKEDEKFWNGNVSFPGRMVRLLFFRLTMPADRDFSMRLKVFSPTLPEIFERSFMPEMEGGAES